MTTTEADVSERARELVVRLAAASVAQNNPKLEYEEMGPAISRYDGAKSDLLSYIASLEAENERLEHQRDEHCRAEARYEEALRSIIGTDIPVGVGAECADWLKGIARRALREPQGE